MPLPAFQAMNVYLHRLHLTVPSSFEVSSPGHSPCCPRPVCYSLYRWPGLRQEGASTRRTLRCTVRQASCSAIRSTSDHRIVGAQQGQDIYPERVLNYRSIRCTTTHPGGRRRMPMTLVGVNETDSGGEFTSIKRRCSSPTGNAILTGAGAGRTISALEDFAGSPRFRI
jgi:hypothetical protein